MHMGLFDALRRKPVEDDYYEYDNYDNEYGYENDYDEEASGSSNVQPIHSMADMEIVISAPTEFKDAVVAADHIRDLKFVVLNLSRMDDNNSARLLDFLSGVAYSEDAHVQRIATGTYVIVPYFVDVMGNV